MSQRLITYFQIVKNHTIFFTTNTNTKTNTKTMGDQEQGKLWREEEKKSWDVMIQRLITYFQSAQKPDIFVYFSINFAIKYKNLSLPLAAKGFITANYKLKYKNKSKYK